VSGSGLGVRITMAVIVAALLPVSVFGLMLVASGSTGATTLVLIALVVAALVGLAVAGLLVGSVVGPLRALETRLDRITAGERVEPLPQLPDDELGRLAERQEELAAQLGRRNRQVARAVDAITAWAPADGATVLLERAATDAREALGLIDARIVLGNPDAIEIEERVPGEPRPVSADLLSGREMAGVLLGHAPATMRWEPADQDVLELFAASVAVALRDAELLARVEEQNARLVALDAEKDDFLRGISHNLQTPLARIRAYADQLAGEAEAVAGAKAAGEAGADSGTVARAAGASGEPDRRPPTEPDRRPAIIAEQSERLSRMVRQLLTVSRLDSGVLRPVAEVFALGPRVRRAWEALGAGDVLFELVDEAGGWLALADPDQVDQVLWALLDNAVRYGGRGSIEVTIEPDESEGALLLAVTDHGPGVDVADRDRLFGRFERGGSLAGAAAGGGSGLGLYVSRALCRAMGGELELAPADPRRGACFVATLPAERAEEI
jgi:signal transduction histidine kinase